MIFLKEMWVLIFSLDFICEDRMFESKYQVI